MEDELTSVFTQFLDTFEGTQLDTACGCWFLEDFSRFSRSFSEIIISRILTPPISPTTSYEQPVLPLFYLIDAICKSCGQIYCGLFAERVPQLFQSSLRHADALLRGKLGHLIRHWSEEGLFNQGVVDLLTKTALEADLDYREQAIAQPDPIPQPVQSYEPWLHAFSAADLHEVAAAPVIERRFARGWMRGSVEWETLPPQSELLIVDIDSQEAPVARVEALGYVIVTPENEKERCSYCSGGFDVAQGPTGENAFQGVVQVPGRGLVHQVCFEHEQTTRLFGA